MGKIHTVIESDVLVVGGAGAGVMSAVRSSQAGASVTLVSKGKVGKSGNTIMIGGGFGIDGDGAREIVGMGDANPEYTREAAFKKLVYSGFFLGDQRLQKAFVDFGPYGVRDCLEWVKHAGQLFFYNARGCSWRTSGAAFGNTVKQGIKEHPEIAVYEDVLIAELLKKGDAVCGVLGIDIYTGEFIQFNAKAVILATGGFQPFSIKNSHSDMTGDGIGLALRAGARAVDMEFLLFIGTILEPVYARGSILPFLFSIPALFSLRPRMRDLDGEELVFPPDDKYKVGPTNGKVNKLLMAEFYGRGIYKKMKKYGNAFYYDYSAYSDDDIRQAFLNYAESQSQLHRRGWYNGTDLVRLGEDIIGNGKRLKVTFGNEYSMGGVVVEPDFSTGVPGLYAAGEVSGGTFGAFRSGDGLTEMLAHGYAAGRSAAEYAASHEQLAADDGEEKAEKILEPFRRTSGLSPVEARRVLEKICDEGFDFYRDGERLARAYDEIVKLRKNLKDLYVPGEDRRYNLEWINAEQVKNLAICAEIGIYGALNRRESRGTHLRADYPEVNNRDYLFNHTAALEGEKILYGKQTPRADYLPPVKENYPGVVDFLAAQVL
ncbi:MAG: FAD-binding protein [Treponema sp.]|jgi:succinate dehydrogenase / fumarate reductase flavoprotein subunit|nr:FAD-binding protein [Treponema sp.]